MRTGPDLPDPADKVGPNGLTGILGVPDGLVVFPDTADGTLPRDRRGRVTYTRAYLTADPDTRTVQPGEPVPGIDERDLAWITRAASRRWPTLLARWGPGADDMVAALCRAGVITVHTNVTSTLRLDVYRSVKLTPTWAAWRAAHRDTAAAEGDAWTRRARAAAEAIAELDPGLAAALRDTPPSAQARLPVLVHAAETLAAGTSFDGPRAFSQALFGDSKARDDAPAILLDAGADPATLAALGLARSPYLGAGGPLIAAGRDGHEIRLAAFAGPVQFRTDPPLAFRPEPGTATLAIIENLQAAEAICDQYPDLAVLWCAGQPSDDALSIMAEAAHGLDVVIAPDADLGGVRIAHRIGTALPADTASVAVLDAGAVSHPRTRRRFGLTSLVGLQMIATGDGPAAPLARACLARGNPVEQEAVIRAAIDARLTGRR